MMEGHLSITSVHLHCWARPALLLCCGFPGHTRSPVPRQGGCSLTSPTHMLGGFWSSHASQGSSPNPLHSKKVRNCQSLSCVRLSATPWAVVHQAPLSIRFSRQEDPPQTLHQPPLSRILPSLPTNEPLVFSTAGTRSWSIQWVVGM